MSSREEPASRSRIAFATCAGVTGIASDDRLVVAPLGALGVQVVPWVWDDPAGSPEGVRGVVLRSCWDYHEKTAAFLAWLERLQATNLPTYNPLSTVRWNLDKRYLRDLEARGAVVPRTAWIEAGARDDLGAILAENGFIEAVVKPRISLSACDTWRTSAATASADQPRFEALTRGRAVLVQEYLPAIATSGELSFVFLGGRFSHAVRKLPAPGDFRVQRDHGGTRALVTPTPAALAEAERIVGMVDEELLLARVDMVEVEGRLVVMELEAIDPELYLALCPEAPARFARCIARAFGEGP